MDTWSYSWAIRNLIAEFLMPPGIFLIVILMTLLIIKRSWLRNTLIVASVVGVWLTSTNYFAIQITKLAGYVLEWPQPLDIQNLGSNAQHPISNNKLAKDLSSAIIVLGGGRRKGAIDVPEYQNQDVSAQAAERLRHAARLARTLNIPILLSGGAPDRTTEGELSEAQVMAQVLRQELGIDAKWIEDQSNTTEENLKNSLAILSRENIEKVYLVTHFWHMPRAMQTVKVIQKNDQKEGFKPNPIVEQKWVNITVIAAPHGYYQKEQYTPLDFYPSAEGFQRTRWIFHELWGALYYRIK